jgi:hypothetical protein
LVADQIFADGALQTIAQAMQGGHDACLACTPRVEIDIIEGILANMGTAAQLTLSNRDMVDLLLNFPHPTLVAKTVREESIRLSAAHQFFWRVAADTFVSRCFLVHMLCIKPTCRPRDIAAPCDFSFVTELAPGGNYCYLVDSDAFLALELQEAAHEAEFITPYDLGPADIAESISAWATAMHHENAKATFVFRGGKSRYPATSAAKMTQPYLNQVLAHIAPPIDHRHHPFWLGAVGATILTAEALPRTDGSGVPPVLRRLIAAQTNALAPLGLTVLIADRPSSLDQILASGARTAVRIPAGALHGGRVEDVAGPGGSILIVQIGNLQNFLELFSDRSRVSQLLRVAGDGRALLLCYEIDSDALRNPSTARLDLYRTFAARLSVFARFGLTPRIHDLADNPLEISRGFVGEVVSDDKAVAAPEPSGRFRDVHDDLLYGMRGVAAISVDDGLV